MTLPTILYFSSILLTCLLTGFLAWYAWKHDQVPASRAYMRLTLSECFFALAEIFSVLSPSSTTALFWFQARYLAGAFMGVFWFVFALEYNGHKEWLSKRLMAGLFVIPFVTQVLLWTNSLHGMWMKQEAGFTQTGIFWIADITTRIPGLGYLMHSFYTLLLTLAGIALMFLTAWKMRREFIGQALMLAGAGLTAFTFAMNSLFNFLPKTGFNPFTPGIGLSVLLIALSVFRFEFLKRAPADESASLTRLDAQEKYSAAIFILIFILFTSGLAAASYLTYQNYERQFSAQVENQLSAIASLKVDELQNWRDERLADASLFYRNKNFSWRVQRYLDNPQDPTTKAELLTWMEKIQSHPEYTRIFLLNPQGVDLISIPDTAKTIPEDLIQQASACLESGEISFLDFHRHSAEDVIHLSILIPIFNAQAGNRPLGVLVLLIDPNVYLYPFIQQWPVPSQSAETLLVRRDGEDVVYLNRLKFEENTALNLRIPLKETQVPAVQAVLGQTGIVHGLDYRGVEVTGDVRAVSDSPWFLVSKMDTAEVYAPLRERLWQTILFFGLLVLITGAGLMLIWRQQRIRFYRGQVAAAEALKETEHTKTELLKKLNDAQHLAMIGSWEWDLQTNQVWWSDETYRIFGVSQQDFIPSFEANGKFIHPDDLEKYGRAFEHSFQTGAPLELDIRLVCGNGSLKHCHAMGRIIRGDAGQPIQFTGTITDITARKQAEDALRESEERFRQMFEKHDAIMLLIEPHSGLIMDANQSAAKFYGYEKPELCAMNINEINALSPEQVAEERQSALNEERNYFVFPHRLAGGRERIVEVHSSPITFKEKQVLFSIIHDITERKQMEEALRESEDKFKYVFEYSVVGKSITQFNGGMQVNEALCDMLGYSPQEMQEKKWQEITHPDDIELTQKEIATLLSGEKESVRFEKRFIHKNGSIVWVDLSSTIRRDSQRKPLYLMSAVIDITERKQAEEKLRETNEYLNNLINYANAPIIVWDPQFKITRFNQASETLTGRSAADMLGKPLGILFPPALIQVSTKLFQKTLSGERLEGVEVSVQHVDGSIRTVMWNSATLFSAGGAFPIAIIAQGQDITERKRAENALRESEEKYRSLIQSIQVGVVVHAPDSSILFSNPRASELLGLTPDQMRGKTAIDPAWRFIREDETRMPLEEYPVNRALVTNAPISNLILGVLRPDRVRPTWVQSNAHQDRDLNGNLQQVVISFADITERKQAEEALQGYNIRLETEVEQRTRELREAQEQLVRQERLATLGQLAGSIGHELRNPLGVISNAIYFLKMTQPDASDKVREYLDIIEKETRTSDKIVTDLLDFTRIKSLDRQPASVSELIHQALERNLAPESVEMELEIPADLPQIYVDPQHVIQVLGNLISNAFQSMTPESGRTNGRKLTVSAVVESAMIKVNIQDMGVGIPLENMKKLFEPLFTTKIKGIGLGLAVSRKLTEANGGRIEVESEAGKGSTFTVYLPVYEESK